MTSLVQVSRSNVPIVTLEEAADHIRRDDTKIDDDLIQLYLDAATRWAENYTGLSLADTTWDYYLDGFPGEIGETVVGSFSLPKPPIIEIIEIAYRDIGGASTFFSGFGVDSSGQRIYLPINGLWPATDGTANAVRIRYRAGFFDSSSSPLDVAGEVPADIKAAILIYMANLYANRESIVTGMTAMEIPWSAKELLRQRRVETSIA